MAKRLKATSRICTRIVVAFLHFLSIVDGETNVDKGYITDLEHALKEIFRLSESDLENKKPKKSLVKIFKFKAKRNKKVGKRDISSTSIPAPAVNANDDDDNNDDDQIMFAPPPFQAHEMRIQIAHIPLFREFRERINAAKFYEPILGEDYVTRYKRAKDLFKSALKVLIDNGAQTFDDLLALANALQTQGHKALNEMNYFTSIEFYTSVIAMFQDNAEFFCDRASALMMVGRYQDALNDCYVAVKLNPEYIRAYQQIGNIYFQQGKMIDAICYGFIKVLQIDPQNRDALAKLEVSEDKLKRQLLWMNEQLAYHNFHDFIPVNNYSHNVEHQEDIVMTFQATQLKKGVVGNDNSTSKPTWKRVAEEEVNPNNNPIIANFCDMFGLMASNMHD